MSTIVHGGRNTYGTPLGMLMTDSQFPRIVGDNGNAATWRVPVLFRTVPGATPGRVVRELADKVLYAPFLAAAKELQGAGVGLITTSCGFLVLFQDEIQRELKVPFLSSSLLQVPWIASLLPPGQSVGIMTIEKASLTEQHLQCAGIDDSIQIDVVGMEEHGGHFRTTVLENQLDLDVDRARNEHLQAAKALIEQNPRVGAIVLECTNMPPFADAIRTETRLPVYDLRSMVHWALSAIGDGQLQSTQMQGGYR